MGKYLVLKSFEGLKEKKLFKEDEVIELTDERYKEIVENLSDFEGEYIEPYEEKNNSKLSNDEIKALLTDKGIEFDVKANKEQLLALLEG